MKRALLLNQDYQPLNFISDERAIMMLFKGRAEIVTNMEGLRSVWPDAFFASVSQKFEIPATIRLFDQVKRKWKPPRFRKKVLFNRDGWSCQYCGIKLFWNNIEVEHIMPTSRGGQTTWFNCVASCKPCNKHKANQTPDEAHMKLLSVPREPSPLHFWDIARSSVWNDDWELFVPSEAKRHR